MRMVEVIEKKRDGQALSTAEIDTVIKRYTQGEIPDYQMSALLMAIVWRGMDDREICDLTLAMAHSGEVLDLKDIAPCVVDKHSTGGVGDKVSLVAAPIVASCGVPVGKMSGRGLGFSGGTLDKLESIPGFRSDLTVEEFRRQLRDIGFVLAGQSANLAPADGMLYALRDVTGTVPSLPLIAASIMSKKIAGGADAIVLDVKVGTGAFMKDLESARELAQTMVRIGDLVGRRVVAHLSDMNQPLGAAVGNSLEVAEALEVLSGGGPTDLREHCLVIAAEMLYLAGAVTDPQAGLTKAELALASGDALRKFRELVGTQGGDVRYVDDPSLLPRAKEVVEVPAPVDGYLAAVRADEIGLAVVELGGGRQKKGDRIDHSVGLVMRVKIGDAVERGQPLFAVYANSPAQAEQAASRVLRALQFSGDPVAPLPLFYERIA